MLCYVLDVQLPQKIFPDLLGLGQASTAALILRDASAKARVIDPLHAAGRAGALALLDPAADPDKAAGGERPGPSRAAELTMGSGEGIKLFASAVLFPLCHRRFLQSSKAKITSSVYHSSLGPRESGSNETAITSDDTLPSLSMRRTA